MTREELLAIKDDLTKEELSDMLDTLLEEEKQKKIEKWRVNNGFNTNWITYVYFCADSYTVKDTLKECGFRYNPVLKWHIDTPPAGYEDKVIPIKLSHIGEMKSYGKVEYYADASFFIDEKCAAVRPPVQGAFIGDIGKKIKEYPARLSKVSEFFGKYGTSNIFTFVDEDNNELQWMTSTEPNIEVNVWYYITATVKDHKERSGKRVTYINRCKFLDY